MIFEGTGVEPVFSDYESDDFPLVYPTRIGLAASSVDANIEEEPNYINKMPVSASCFKAKVVFFCKVV